MSTKRKNEKRIRKFEQSDLFIIGQITAGTPVTPAPKFKEIKRND